MQYFVSRRDDGQLTGQVVVVTETSAQRSALTHAVGPLQEAAQALASAYKSLIESAGEQG